MAKAKNTNSTSASAAEPDNGLTEPASTAALDAEYAATAKDRSTKDRVREPGVQGVHQLSGDAEVAARTGPDSPVDGKFRKVFVLSARDYTSNADNEDMHRANAVATLQEALNRGVHCLGDARLEGTEETADGSVRLTYVVEAVPASEHEVPAETQTPSKAIKEMGGSTVEHAQDSRHYGTLGAAEATEK